jgi:hypothetical protein
MAGSSEYLRFAALGLQDLWGYLRGEIPGLLREGRPLVGFKTALMKYAPTEEFPFRAAAGERVLPSVRRAPEVPPLSGSRLADFIQNTPLQTPEARRRLTQTLFAGAPEFGYRGLAPSWFGHEVGETAPQTLEELQQRPDIYMKLRWYPAQSSIEAMLEREGIHPKANLLGRLASRRIPFAISPLARRGALDPAVSRVLASELNRALAGRTDVLEALQREAASPNSELVAWLRKLYADDPGRAQEVIARLQQGGDGAKRALLDLYIRHVWRQGMALPLDVGATAKRAGKQLGPMETVPGVIEKASNLLDLRLVSRLQAPLKLATERKFEPLLRVAYLESHLEEAFGPGSADTARALTLWQRDATTPAARAVKEFFQMTTGSVPKDTSEFVLSLARLSRQASEGMRQTPLYMRSFLVSLASAYMDDLIGQATTSPLAEATGRVLSRMGASMAKGSLVLAPLVAGAFAAGTLFSPKPAEAAPVPPEMVNAIAREAGSAAQAHALGEVLREGLSEMPSKASGIIGRVWAFLLSRMEANLVSTADRLGNYLAPQVKPRLMQTVRQTFTSLRDYDTMSNQILGRGVTMLDDVQDLLRANGATTDEAMQTQLRYLRDVGERGTLAARASLAPHQREALQKITGFLKDVYFFNQEDPSLAPYRLNYWPHVLDPNKAKTLLKDSVTVNRIFGEWVTGRERELIDMVRTGGLSAVWREVSGGVLAPEEVAAFRRMAETPEQVRGIFREVAAEEARKTLAGLRQTLIVRPASSGLDAVVAGDVGLVDLPSGLPEAIGVPRNRLLKSVFLTKRRFLENHPFRYDDPREELIAYIRTAARHLAAVRVFGPDARTLRQAIKVLNDYGASAGAFDPGLASHFSRSWEILLERMFGGKATSTEWIDSLNRFLIPFAIISRMTVSGIAHVGQFANIAAVMDWPSLMRALSQISNGDWRVAQKLVELSGGLESWRYVSGQAQDMSAFSRMWLRGIGFAKVRQSLLGTAGLAAHIKLNDLLPLAARGDAAAKTELLGFLRRLGYDVKPTLQSSRDMMARLVDAWRAGEIVPDADVVARAKQALSAVPTGDPYLDVLKSATDMTAFNFNPWEFPAFWQTPLGRTTTLFRRFFYSQLTQVYRMAFDEAKHGNIMPLMSLVAPEVGWGWVLEHARHFLTGANLPWQVRRKPMSFVGIDIPRNSLGEKLIDSAIEGGVGGFLNEAVRHTLDPQAPSVMVIGTVLGFWPGQFAEFVLTGYGAAADVFHGGLDPEKTHDLAQARAFLRWATEYLPFVGGRIVEAYPEVYRTGVARYRMLRRQAIQAGLQQDWTTMSAINTKITEMGGRPITGHDLWVALQEEQGTYHRRPRVGEPRFVPQQMVPAQP